MDVLVSLAALLDPFSEFDTLDEHVNAFGRAIVKFWDSFTFKCYMLSLKRVYTLSKVPPASSSFSFYGGTNQIYRRNHALLI